MELKKTVNYEDFGAIGDGKTDEFDAISKAHAYANENGLDVVTDGTKTYYIGDTGIGEKENKPAIKIKTNVDWNTSKFIIDDSSITSSMFSRVSKFFSRFTRLTVTHLPSAISRGPISIRRGTPFISYSENFHPGLLSESSTLTLN